ncbi:MAG: translation elongation factor Ts [Nitrospiraceae bacterium]|nr:translation elongation factor Ts [Nitrospiraceae bacterium]MDA8325184.1 translation elongation factor Ts [Nitrospiraceae bacterium]
MITAELVRDLREKTGAGMMECKKALEASGGDLDKAVDILRQKGMATAQKKSARAASQGLVSSYIHMDKIGVLLELNCETDFVARTDDFRGLAKDIAMHVAAASPAYLQREDVPQDVLDHEKEIYKAQVQGKPDHVVEKIIQGKIEKFYEESCLLDQIFVKDPEGKKKVKDIITEKVAKIGENIVVRRFARYQLGESKSAK